MMTHWTLLSRPLFKCCYILRTQNEYKVYWLKKFQLRIDTQSLLGKRFRS